MYGELGGTTCIIKRYLSIIIQLLTSISVDIRIYQPEKVIFTEAGDQGEYHF